MNIIDEIQTIVTRESKLKTDRSLRWRIRDALALLAGMECAEYDPQRWFEYEITIPRLDQAEEETQILNWLRSLDIAAAPEVAATISFGDNSCVLVRRYWACPGERLLTPHPNSHVGPRWPEAACTRFRDDMAKIAAHGKVHPYARGYAHMYLSERTGTILLNTWSVLTAAREREQREFLESIDFQIQRRT